MKCGAFVGTTQGWEILHIIIINFIYTKQSYKMLYRVEQGLKHFMTANTLKIIQK